MRQKSTTIVAYLLAAVTFMVVLLWTTPAVADMPIKGTAQQVGGVIPKALLDLSYRQSGRKPWHPRHHAFKTAMAQRGDPYRWGARGPDAFDCSGLVVYAYSRAGIHLPRTSTAQRAHARAVHINHARPGDLLFYSGHVEMYAGRLNGVHYAPCRKHLRQTGEPAPRTPERTHQSRSGDMTLVTCPQCGGQRNARVIIVSDMNSISHAPVVSRYPCGICKGTGKVEYAAREAWLDRELLASLHIEEA